MLGISAEVGALPVLKAREQVSGFIEDLRFLSRGQEEFNCNDGQENDGDGTIRKARRGDGPFFEYVRRWMAL
jgi:hypothetical protein